MLILLVVFFADDPWYSLNLYTQSIGYYAQYIVQVGWHTDAFAQTATAPDGREVDRLAPAQQGEHVHWLRTQRG